MAAATPKRKYVYRNRKPVQPGAGRKLLETVGSLGLSNAVTAAAAAGDVKSPMVTAVGRLAGVLGCLVIGAAADKGGLASEAARAAASGLTCGVTHEAVKSAMSEGDQVAESVDVFADEGAARAEDDAEGARAALAAERAAIIAELEPSERELMERERASMAEERERTAAVMADQAERIAALSGVPFVIPATNNVAERAAAEVQHG